MTTRRRRIRLGLALPTAGDLAGADAITQAAEGAERVGLDSVWTFERLLSPVGGVEMGGQTVPLPEAYKSVYARSKCSRTRPRRPPGSRWALSTSSATAGSSSGSGRAGWTRSSRRRACRGPVGAGFAEPVQAGGPPVVVAASAPASVRRTARLGFGSNPIWFGWEATTAAVQGFRKAVTEAGGDPDERPVVLRVNESLTEQPNGTEPTLAGSPEQAAEALPRLAQLGVTEVLWSMDMPVDDQLGLMSQLVG